MPKLIPREASPRKLLLSVSLCVALVATTLATATVATLVPASPANGQGSAITALSATACTDGTFIHTGQFTRRDGANNDIYDDCESLVALQNSLAAQSANNALATNHVLRTWGTGTATQQKLSSTSLISRTNAISTTWSKVGVGYAGTTILRIRSLELTGIQSSGFPSGVLNLTGLRILNLSNNRISSLPTQIGDLTGLTTLNLSENNIGSLPTQIGQLTNLTTLSLSENRLASIPTEIGQLTRLNYLYLNDNQLTSLPTQIGNLIFLYLLSLHNNQLTSLPSSFGNLRWIQYLQLYNNRLTSLPATIGNFRNLFYAYLHNNNLTSLPTTIGNHTGLVQLWLHNNNLSSLPTQIGSLTRLTHLYLHNNNLSSLPTEIGNMASLAHLWLDNNDLRSLPAEIRQLTSLQILRVGSNRLTSFEPFVGLQAASGNRLAELYLCPNFFTDEIPTALYNARVSGAYVVQNRIPNNCWGPPRTVSTPQLPSVAPNNQNQDTSITPLNSAGCTDGTFIHTNLYTRIDGPNNDIYDDCENLVAIQNALAARDANNALHSGHALRYWGLASQNQGKLTPNIAPSSGSTSTRGTWPGVSVGLNGSSTLRVRSLTLSGIKGSTFPSQVGNLTGLATLNLSHNTLVSLPKELSQLTNLRYLSVANNRLTSFTPLVELLAANGGSLEELHLCPNYFSVPIPKALFEAQVSGAYVVRNRPPDHCWGFPWDILTAPSTISSLQGLRDDLGLSDDNSIWSWDALNQIWVDITSTLSEGDAVAFRALPGETTLREALNPGLEAEDPDIRNPGIANQNVTITLRNGWNILRSPAAPENPNGFSAFDESLWDCSSLGGTIATVALNLGNLSETLTWRLALPCNPNLLSSLTARGIYSELTELTGNDVLYVYFRSALPVQISWSVADNNYQSAR